MRRNKRLLLLLILISATLVRFYRIDQPYNDLAGWRQTSVAMMAENFYRHNPNILFPEVSWNGPGESYNGREFQTVSYISSLLYHVVGQHDWVGRLVALLFGVWGVFALHQLVLRIWGLAHALAAAAVLAILPGALFIDRCFLPDPAMVSLVTTGVWMLVTYLQTNNNRYLLLTAVFACWGFLSKITGMVLLLPMLYATLSILQARKSLNVATLARIAWAGLAVVAIVAAYYIWARHLSLAYPPYHFAGEGNWIWNEGISSWIAQRFFLPTATYIFKAWTVGMPFICLAIAGIFVSVWRIYNKKKQGEPMGFHAPFLFHFWLLGVLIFYFIGGKEIVLNFWNFHIWHPMIAAFCGSTIVALWGIFKKYNLLGLVTGIVLLAWIAVSNRRVLPNTFTDQYYITDYRMGVRLNQLRQPNDLVVVLAREIGSPIAIFYSRGRGWVFPPAGKEIWDVLPPTDEAAVAILERLRQQGAAWFSIYRKQYDTIRAAYPMFAQHLTRNFSVAAEAPDYIIFKLR
jgi:4-amino-4-deoxy-L-arabinose transferase-like glycosyltransferase